MALIKPIKQIDGVVTNYHRILFLQKNINNHNSIAVLSYIDDAARDGEKEATLQQPYCHSVTYITAYDAEMTVADAYDYLKTLPEFDGAVDA